jgi:Ca2+-binding RTX toxin-like protein
MHVRNLLSFLAIISALTIGSVAISWNFQTASAAAINCAGFTTNPCVGTTQSDSMVGDDNSNTICGKQGDDYILGRGGQDNLLGNEGNDRILGGDGSDQIVGGATVIVGCGVLSTNSGADIIQGGPGNDRIYHGNSISGKEPTDPDGFKDIIDCGPGDDTAFINTASDGDVAMNCEHVNP